FPEEECPLLAPRSTGEVVRVEEDWFIRSDGAFVPVAYSSAPVPTADGRRGAVVVFQDITHRLAAQEALVRERAVRASRTRIVEATAYFVAAEALANVAKHAGATEATVRIARAEDESLVVEVCDDGRGGAAVGRAGSSGLSGLSDRVAALDGMLTVESPPGGGT